MLYRMNTTGYRVWDVLYMRAYDVADTREQAERQARFLQMRLGRPFEVR
jgi:hypothetical protein